jgi:hypothetical protein
MHFLKMSSCYSSKNEFMNENRFFCNVPFIQNVGQSLYTIKGKFKIYPSHIPISPVCQLLL